MQIDKILYNITIQKTKEAQQQYIKQLDKESLERVKKEIIEKMNEFDPDDENIIQEIQLALKVYQQAILQKRELLGNQYFSQMTFEDESFIMNLGFYMGHQKTSGTLVLAMQLVEHQVMDLKEKAYYNSVNLIKSLSQIFQFIDEKYYQRVVFLMVEMIIQNKSLLQQISDRYDFLECLIQVINKQQEDKIIIYLFGFLRDLYSDKNIKLFHQKDLQVLIEIILRIINDSQNQILIEETLRLYAVLKQNSMLSNGLNKMIEIKEALNDKLGFLDPKNISQSLKKIIDNTLYNQQEVSKISE